MELWSWALAAVGLLGIHLAGRKQAVGWLVGVAAQGLWLVYAVVTSQWGFLVTAVAYAAMYGKNWLAWRRETDTRQRATVEVS
jgi:hypothetical protein